MHIDDKITVEFQVTIHNRKISTVMCSNVVWFLGLSRGIVSCIF